MALSLIASALGLLATAPAFAAPPNDNFSDRTAVGPALPVDVDGTTVDATTEAGEPPYNVGPFGPARSVWYEWTPAADTRTRISVCAFDRSLQVSVFTGTAVNSLTPVADGNDGSCRHTFDASGGTAYQIAVFSASEVTFDLDLHVLDPPANDDFEDAQPVGPVLPVGVAGTTVDATRETGEPNRTLSAIASSVWYAWTPGETGQVTVDVCTGPMATGVGVFTGTAVDALSQVATSGAACSLSYGAISGVDYKLLVDSQLQEGAFTLSVFNTPATPIPPQGSSPPAAQVQQPTFRAPQTKRKKCKKGQKRKKRKCVKRKRKK